MVTLHSRLLEREGKYSAALKTAVRALQLEPEDIGRALDICAPARKVGRIKLAERLARGALNRLCSGAKAEGDLMSRALFETIYALRLRGKTQEARKELVRFAGDLDLYGGPNWVAWARCQEGCLQILDPSCDGTPDVALRESIELFKELADLHKVAAVQGNLVTALRARKAYSEAQKELDLAKHLRRELARRSAFESEALSFEEAELLRAAGCYDRASEAYQNLSRSESGIHRMLALLGLASLGRKEESIVLAEMAIVLGRRQGIAFGVVQGYVRINRAGAIADYAAVSAIRELLPFLSRPEAEAMFLSCSSESALIFPS